MNVVGPRVLENYKFLHKIAKSKSNGRRLSLLKNASSDQLLSLVEVASNILNSNFALTKRQKSKILPHIDYIRKLARIRSETGARNFIVQRGGGFFLPSLLVPVITEAARLLISSSIGGGSKGVVEDQ
jgi:hypothetical protein